MNPIPRLILVVFQNGVFTSIEFEGSGLVGPTVTNAYGINPRGDIVGSYTDPTTNGKARVVSPGACGGTTSFLSAAIVD